MKSLLDLAFPPACVLCNRQVPTTHDFCETCQVALTMSEQQLSQSCRQCGFPVGRTFSQSERIMALIGEQETDIGELSAEIVAPVGPENCPQCRDKTFQFQEIVAMWHYHGKVCDAVIAAKYVRRSALAAALGRRLGECVAARYGLKNDDTASPINQTTFVPSYFTRQLLRGGIGIRSVADAVASILGVTCRPLLKTVRQIAKQALLDDEQRLKNVRDAFKVKNRYALLSPDLTGQHILLVDDVYTSGATLNEAARVLREAGAARVTACVIARTVRA